MFNCKCLCLHVFYNFTFPFEERPHRLSFFPMSPGFSHHIPYNSPLILLTSRPFSPFSAVLAVTWGGPVSLQESYLRGPSCHGATLTLHCYSIQVCLRSTGQPYMLPTRLDFPVINSVTCLSEAPPMPGPRSPYD